MIKVKEAQNIIRKNIFNLSSEQINISNSSNRILAQELYAQNNHPNHNVSAMDGYALNIKNINPSNYFKIIGESAAGSNIDYELKENEGIKVYTGSKIPKGANTVLIQENAIFENNKLFINKIEINRHIRKKGQNFKKKDLLLGFPKKISYRDIGLMALDDREYISVYRKPKVSILSTGDEIVFPGQKRGPNQFPSANGPALSAFVEDKGGNVIYNHIEKDNLNSITHRLQKIQDSDLIITTGGASVGEKDYIKSALKKLNAIIFFEKVSIKPGKPIIFAKTNNTPIFCLPGNPVSALICAEIFLRIGIDRLVGLPGNNPIISQAVLKTDIPENGSRENYLRAKLIKNSQLCISPFLLQDSNMILDLAHSDALIVLEPFQRAMKKGELVSFIKI